MGGRAAGADALVTHWTRNTTPSKDFSKISVIGVGPSWEARPYGAIGFVLFSGARVRVVAEAAVGDWLRFVQPCSGSRGHEGLWRLASLWETFAPRYRRRLCRPLIACHHTFWLLSRFRYDEIKFHFGRVANIVRVQPRNFATAPFLESTEPSVAMSGDAARKSKVRAPRLLRLTVLVEAVRTLSTVRV